MGENKVIKHPQSGGSTAILPWGKQSFGGGGGGRGEEGGESQEKLKPSATTGTTTTTYLRVA